MVNNCQPTSGLMLDTAEKKSKRRRRSSGLLEGEVILQGAL
jgi:hypothetical protein